MLQYYLRAEGLALSWVGTGRFIFSLNFTDADFAEVEQRFVAAAQKMKRDGWWWHSPHADQQGDPPPDPQRDDRQQVRALRLLSPSPCERENDASAPLSFPSPLRGGSARVKRAPGWGTHVSTAPHPDLRFASVFPPHRFAGEG